MTRSVFHSLRLFCLVSLSAVLAFFGCARHAEVNDLVVVIPDRFDADGVTWEKKDWSDSAQEKLKGYFARNASLADNPIISGERVLYVNAKGVERYYWVQPAENSSQWLLLEFQGQKLLQMQEKSGAPFESIAKPKT